MAKFSGPWKASLCRILQKASIRVSTLLRLFLVPPIPLHLFPSPFSVPQANSHPILYITSSLTCLPLPPASPPSIPVIKNLQAYWLACIPASLYLACDWLAALFKPPRCFLD